MKSNMDVRRFSTEGALVVDEINREYYPFPTAADAVRASGKLERGRGCPVDRDDLGVWQLIPMGRAGR